MKIKISDTDKADWNTKTKIRCIYQLQNMLDNKIYIGQSKDFRKRVSEYLHADENLSNRLIIKTIRNVGQENFLVTILERCDNHADLNEREAFWIKKKRSENPDIGYNTLSPIKKHYSELANIRKSISHTGLKESDTTKRKKSNMIIAISDSKVIVADSAKLFGDLMGKTKDMVKNYLRVPLMTEGFHVYYNDYDKRQDIRKRVFTRKHSKATKIDLYLKRLDLLDEIEYESVETIYWVLRTNIGKVYRLVYDNSSELGYKLIDLRYEYSRA